MISVVNATVASIFAGKNMISVLIQRKEVKKMSGRYTFNPGFMSDEQSIEGFLVRISEFQRILAAFESTDGEDGERLILIGPRGAGKTTMCRRVLAEVHTSMFLRDRWEPVFLSEESYTVTTPGELLLECLFQLSQQPHWSNAEAAYVEARGLSDEAELHDYCLQFFRREVRANKKRFLIIVENLHMIVRDQLSGDPEELVRLLSDTGLFGVLATAVEQTGEENADTLPYGFTLIPLRPLSLEECQTLWNGLTGLNPDKKRLRPLQILTGGSPRLIHILAEFMHTPSLSDLMDNLNRLIDQNTEYFKNQLDLLPSGERKVFVTLLEAWDPSSAKHVAAGARVPVNLASAALNRLSERGMVEKTPGSGRSILYHASERLFNIYYLMRRRTHPSERVRALVTFMTQYYDQKELVDTTTKLALEACRIEPSQRGDHHSLFSAISKGLSETAREEMLKKAPQDFIESLQRDEYVQRFSPNKDSKQSGPPKRNDYSIALQAGRSALSEGNYTDAEVHIQRAMSLRPKAIQPWILKALTSLFTEDHEAAIAAAATAVEMKPSDMAAHSMLGTTLAAAGRDAEAEIALLKSIEINPEALRAIIELAKLREKQDRKDESAELYRRASSIGELPDADAARFARLLMRTSRFDEAERVLRQATQRSNDQRSATRLLAELLHGQSRNSEALEILEIAARNSDQWEAWADYSAFLLDAEDDAEAAEEAIKKALSNNVSSPVLYWILARAMEASGSEHTAIAEVAHKCLQAHMNETSAWIFAGQIFELIDQDDQAEAVYRDALASEQDEKEQAWLFLGRLLSQHTGRAEEAEQALRSAVEISGRSHCGPFKDLAELLVHRGNDTQAYSLVKEALEINKRCFCSLLLKSQIDIRNQNIDSAVELLRRAIEINPHSIHAITELASIVQSDEAVQLIEKANDIASGHPLVLLARGRLQERSLPDRLNDIQRAIEIDSDLAEGKLALAELHSLLDDDEKVASLMSEVLAAVRHRMELIPSFVDSAIEIVGHDKAHIMEQVLAGPGGGLFEPLLVALQMLRGDNPVIAKEVEDVAFDIFERIKGRNGT